MVYVQRNGEGTIVGIYEKPQIGEEPIEGQFDNDGAPVMRTKDYAPEQLADDDPEVVAFRAEQAPRLWVRRDEQGQIVETSRGEAGHLTESLPLDHPDLVAFDHADEVKQERIDIEADRDAALAAGVVWENRRYHLDNVFQLHVVGLIAAYQAGLIPANASTQIRTMDNELVMLNLDQLKALAGTVLAAVQAVYAQSWAAKDALN